MRDDIDGEAADAILRALPRLGSCDDPMTYVKALAIIGIAAMNAPEAVDQILLKAGSALMDLTE